MKKRICAASVAGLAGLLYASSLNADIITGAGFGGGPHVKVFSGAGSAERHSFFAYDPNFTGGVRVGGGFFNADRYTDIITGAGPGGQPHIKVFDGRTGLLARSFFAFDRGFTGGVYVAAGDVNGDSRSDIIASPDAGTLGPHVRVFDAVTGNTVRDFFAYDSNFTGGVRVAAGDINNDGIDDIITGPGATAGPHVKVFDGVTGNVLHSFFAYDPGFMGGVFVGSGDVNGDGFDDIITGADGGAGGHVKVFNGINGELLNSFFAFDPNFTGGVRVAAADIDGDTRSEIIVGAGPGGGPHVRVFDGMSGGVINSFFAYDSGFSGGVYVAGAVIPAPGAFATLLVAFATGTGRRRRR